MPPWPGKMLLKSLTPIMRLSRDSARSPICPMVEATKEVSIHTQKGMGETARKIAQQMTPVTSEDREPQMEPSQVFFGETRGASLCLPNRVPPKRAAVSQIQEEAHPRTRVCHQMRLTEMTIRMPKSTQG